MLDACAPASRWLCRRLTGFDMTLCAYAWWRKDKRRWRIVLRGLDRVARHIERDHCRRSYERRFPKV